MAQKDAVSYRLVERDVVRDGPLVPAGNASVSSAFPYVCPEPVLVNLN